jgi:CRISPR-associated endonuclease Csn1
MATKKIIGLDLGSSSIGWTIRNEDDTFKSGVVTFDSGMVKGTTGGYISPTKVRREARSRRRLLQARRYRKWALLEVLIENKMTPLTPAELAQWSKYKKGQPQKFPENETFKKWLACDFTYLQNGKKFKNPYELRVAATDNKVIPHEFGRALYHLVQRRGYKNIGESDLEELNIEDASNDAETKKQLERRKKEGFAAALQKHNGIISKSLKYEFLDKGKRARNEYPLRKEYSLELEAICKTQGHSTTRDNFGKYQDKFVQKIWKAIIWQRPLRSQKGNIGRCTLEPSKPRCPSSHPLFEIFRAWQLINTIKYENKSGQWEFLPQDIRNKLYEDFFLKNDRNIKFERIKIFLDKQFSKNKKYNYKDDHSVSTMPVCKGLIDIFGNEVKQQILNLEKYIIGGSHYKDDSSRKVPKIIKEKYSVFDLWHSLYSFDEVYLKTFAKEKLDVADKTTLKGRVNNPFVELKKILVSSFSDLSVKAISKIIPFLKEGHLYNEAVLLAKMPELMGKDWEEKKTLVIRCINEANKQYAYHKMITTIANKLIDTWKGMPYHEKFAYKDFNYTLQKSDIKDILEACQKHFGEITWIEKENEEKNIILKDVRKLYQEFFKDQKREYRKTPTLDELMKHKFSHAGIVLNGELYHHASHENRYLKNIGTKADGTPKLPIDKKSGIEILPVPLIDSIKNPMFNKALFVLRKLVNHLIIQKEIDNETEIVIEVARELNDINLRNAIERYQRERENSRKIYKKFLEEFKTRENLTFNVDENIPQFELWTDQLFNEGKTGEERLTRHNIMKEKDAVKRYELWMEQKGQCMYTGKLISVTQLFSNEIDIEHTIPRSLLPDNTLANQTVCYARYNRDKKKNQLPTQCENFSKDVEGWGSAIEPRLRNWEEIRKHYEEQYEKNKRPRPGEDEDNKNKRIQNKHYYKMHLDYWTDKIERFTCTEIKESWVRRQLTDTQMISKYAREFLSTYFKQVKVQKGSVTANFRKIYGFQEEDEIKSRNLHTHHAIDAAVLTLIPTNSSYRERLLKTMYEWQEQKRGQFTTVPFNGFNAQTLINQIESTVLVVNYQKDNLLKETRKKVRNRGRLVYVKDREGRFVLDASGNRIVKWAKGDSVRSPLYKETFLAKLKNVERDENDKPIRNGDKSWQFKRGDEEFFYAIRVSIDEAKKYIDDIIDPVIRDLVRNQKNKPTVLDYNNKPIRHVRIITSAGRKVKQRFNHQSKYDYKNYYYAASGSLPYAALLEKAVNGKPERKLIPISSAEIVKHAKKHKRFEITQFIEENYPEHANYPGKKLLKVGQKAIVLENEKEYELKDNKEFQLKRLYVISQFHYTGSKILFNYHLESRAKGDIDKSVKELKSNILIPIERHFAIPEILPDDTIANATDRNKDFEKRLYDFNTRLKRIESFDKAKANSLKVKIEEIKTESSKCNDMSPVPILGRSANGWNFLLEGEDFEITLSGEYKWIMQKFHT